jgi:hypothetical protein
MDLGKYQVDRNTTCYVFDSLKIKDSNSGINIVTLKSSDYKEIGSAMPKVRKLDKIYIFRKPKPLFNAKKRLAPIILEAKYDDSDINNSMLIMRRKSYAHQR